MTIGFRSPYQNISTVLGKLSGFNLWSYPIKAEEILRMSQGCGNEAGDVKAWETVRKGLTKEVEVKRHRSCRHRKGKFYLTSLIRGTRRQFLGKYLFGRRFEIQNFRNICCKISCLPASPRIFEHLKYGIIEQWVNDAFELTLFTTF